MIKLKEIINFKSFKDTEWSKLNKFNVLIGPNRSGKTNFIEFFKFLKKALVEEISPCMPYLDW
jgi:AAA15 family ATPase/GTPase